MLAQSYGTQRHPGPECLQPMNNLPTEARERRLPSVDDEAFRRALGHFASGVTVVTTGTGAGPVAGTTVNAFTAVSLAPPLILVCLDDRSRSCGVLREAGSFAVHILGADQKDTALAFARRGDDKFADICWRRNRRGTPILDGGLVVLECELVREYEGGDHSIFVGRVVHADIRTDGSGPLTYFCGQVGAPIHGEKAGLGGVAA